MDINIWQNLIGYTAMTLLVISFIPKKIKVVRTVNLIACMFFVAYGVLLGWAWPIIISNLAVCGVQIYHIFCERKMVVEKINYVKRPNTVIC